MQNYLVTIPAVDFVDEPIAARSTKKAILKALATDRVLEAVDFDSPLEVIVILPSGKKAIYDAKPILSFRTQKVG